MIILPYLLTPNIIRNQQFDSAKVRAFILNNFDISSENFDVIIKYLQNRKREIKGKESFGVVFVLTNKCNLNCLHCGVNAELRKFSRGHIENEINLDKAKIIIDKVTSYTQKKKFKPFLMFGGGEPSLIRDFPDIIKYASNELGKENIGFCTNGTTFSVDNLLEIEPYVGLIETSVDGLEEEHNLMRDPNRVTDIENPFKTTLQLILDSLEHHCLKSKLEVSAIATKRNSYSLPNLARYLRGIGITKFSIHRAMPVGRMAVNNQSILSKTDYLDLFIEMAKLGNEDPYFKWHMHHSLESIYSVLLLGEDIHFNQVLPMSSSRHSIGIDWEGFVFFDPWSVVSPFEILRSHTLLHPTVDLFNILDNPKDSMVGLVNNTTKRNLRCKRCRVPCGGGMRFNAIYNYVTTIGGQIQDSHFIAGLSEIDPACLISD